MKSRSLKLIALFALLTGIVSGCGDESVVSSDGPIRITSLPIDGLTGSPSFVPTLEGPLRLVSITPADAMEYLPEDQPVTISFSKPMVALGDASAPGPDLLTMKPATEGTLRWEGSQTLVFTPNSTLAMATSYSVTLRGGLTSLDGETLKEPFQWTFETPRPAVTTSRPANYAQFVSPDSLLRLDFNQPIDAKSASGIVRLFQLDDNMERGRRISVELSAVSDSALSAKPQSRLQQDQWYELAVNAGMKSLLGSLPSSEPYSLRFRTTPPLRLEAVTQPRSWNDANPKTFDPMRGLELLFSTPVRFSDLRQALTITPALDVQPGIEARDGTVSPSHGFSVQLKPETTYTVRIDNLRDAQGQLLQKAQTTFRTRAFSPSFSMPQGLLVVEAGESATLPLRVTNVERIKFGAKRLGPADIVPWARTYDGGHYYPRIEDDNAQDPISAGSLVDLDVERNKPTMLPFNVDSLLTDNMGILGLHVVPVISGSKQQSQDRLLSLAQFTHLGITGKFSAHQNLIFVTDLASSLPVAGARVTIRGEDNRVAWEGTTDAKGRAESPGWDALGLDRPNEWSAPTQYAIVEHKGDLAFTTSVYRDGLEPYRFNMMYDWQPAPIRHAGSLFSDRGLYLAAETIHLKGIVRRRTDADWQSVRDSVRVLIADPQARVVLDQRLLPSDMGTFNLDWTAPESSVQGYYRARIFMAADTSVSANNFWGAQDIGSGSFQVEAFRRATFEVDVRSAASSVVAGDFFEGSISGRYLFGAAMRGQPVSYRLERTPGSFHPPGFKGYLFSTYDWFSGVYRDIARADSVLDRDGTVNIRAQAPGNESGAVTQLVFTGTVTDPARQEITTQKSITVHPGLFYIGLKPRSTYVSLSDTDIMAVDLVTVTPDGYPVGGRDLELTLIRRQWNSIREIGADGRLRWRSEQIEETVARQKVTSVEGRSLRLDLPIAQGGSYVIRATSRDVRGNRIATEAYFHASGPGYSAWERRDDDQIELIADHDSYAPGETAQIMVLSPYETATALITIERDGIMESRVETLTGSAPQIEVKLTEEHLPNAFVSVVLLSGRTAKPGAGVDAGAPGFKIGYAELRVDPGVRHLHVSVGADRTEYRPGDEVTVEFRLLDEDNNGVAGEIAFSAADAGVLNLIGYALPDPFLEFYGPRPLGVTTTESRANLVRQRNFGQKEEGVGGGGGGGDSRLRQDFKPSAHWAPALRTDSRGRAKVTFRVPESLTTFRLMATGLTADHRFGAGRTDITVTKPLVMQAALPRFARLGDTFEAGVLVTNTTGSNGTATITAAAEGLTLTGPASKSVALQDGETKEVRFGWKVPSTGTAYLSFSGSLGSEKDALRVPLTLTRPLTKQTVATFASTSGSVTEALMLPKDVVPDLGGWRIRLASTSLVGLDGALDYLFTYPYGCLEQRTSAVRPLFLADDLLASFDLTALSGDRDDVIAAWISDLQGFWVGNGFAMWQGNWMPNPYVSAYTVLAMAEAEAAGFAVPQDLLSEALDVLEQNVRDRDQTPDYYGEAAWDESRALMLYALARNGRVLSGEIDDLAVRATKGGLGVDGTSFLIRTILIANQTALRPHIKPLLGLLKNRIVMEGTTAHLTSPTGPGMNWIFMGDVRSTAFGLTALVEADPSEDTRLVAERMVRYLIQSREREAWSSTQENAAVIDALAAYFRVFESVEPDFTAKVQLAGQQIIQKVFKGRSMDVTEATRSLEKLPKMGETPVLISKDGTGHLFYSMQLQSWSNAPLPAASQGITVERRIQRLDDGGQPIGPEMLTGDGTVTLDSGDLVRVILRVHSNSERSYVVVDDALPAGLEALNSALATTDSDLIRQAQDDTEMRWWGSFNFTQIKDDRVQLFADFFDSGTHTYVYVARATTPGTFRYPSVQAEMMYRPEINGRTATGTLVVAPPK
ncbi:Ig-like domain-containing protein [bacterium]|nr:Ig-like domain-containing protein [bacterium]